MHHLNWPWERIPVHVTLKTDPEVPRMLHLISRPLPSPLKGGNKMHCLCITAAFSGLWQKMKKTYFQFKCWSIPGERLVWIDSSLLRRLPAFRPSHLLKENRYWIFHELCNFPCVKMTTATAGSLLLRHWFSFRNVHFLPVGQSEPGHGSTQSMGRRMEGHMVPKGLFCNIIYSLKTHSPTPVPLHIMQNSYLPTLNIWRLGEGGGEREREWLGGLYVLKTATLFQNAPESACQLTMTASKGMHDSLPPTSSTDN